MRVLGIPGTTGLEFSFRTKSDMLWEAEREMKLHAESDFDFFISYASADQMWAEWIAWTLRTAGYSIRIQAWHFDAGSNFTLEMQTATAKSARTIAVLSPHFLASEYTASEWAAAFAADPKERSASLFPYESANANPRASYRK